MIEDTDGVGTKIACKELETIVIIVIRGEGWARRAKDVR